MNIIQRIKRAKSEGRLVKEVKLIPLMLSKKAKVLVSVTEMRRQYQKSTFR